MRTLVLASAISNSLIALAYDALDSGDTVIVDFDDEIHAQLKHFGLSSIPIRVPGDKSWAERDRSFAEKAMPGSLDFNFPGTELPVWKVLSLDRLNFWYRGQQAQQQYEAVMGLEWGKAIAPFSLNHPLPWRLARQKKVIGVQTEFLRTRAWYDWLSRPILFEYVFVWSQREVDFLKSYYPLERLHINAVGDTPVPSPVSKEERQALRKSLNLNQQAKVGLVLFDSQTEWEFRRALPELTRQYHHLLIYPVQAHDARNLNDLGIVTAGNLRVVDALLEAAADELIAFRYDENMLRARRIPLRILDMAGRWESQTLAQ